MLLDARPMLCRRISLIVIPVVVGILLVQTVHIVITIGLGKDRGRSDIHQLAIALHYRLVRYIAIGFELIAIYHYILGAHFQCIQCTVHGKYRCIEDIYLVYLFGRDDAQCPSQRIAFYILTKGIALPLGELLGVVEQGMRIVGREYYRSSIHIARQASTTSLITTSLYKVGMKARLQ